MKMRPTRNRNAKQSGERPRALAKIAAFSRPAILNIAFRLKLPRHFTEKNYCTFAFYTKLFFGDSMRTALAKKSGDQSAVGSGPCMMQTCILCAKKNIKNRVTPFSLRRRRIKSRNVTAIQSRLVFSPLSEFAGAMDHKNLYVTSMIFRLANIAGPNPK